MELTTGTASFGAGTRARNVFIERRTCTGEIGGECLRAGHSLNYEGTTTEVGGARNRGTAGQEQEVKRARGPNGGTEVVCLVEKGNYHVCVSVGKTFAVMYGIGAVMENRGGAEPLERKTATSRMGKSRAELVNIANSRRL